ncbi:MAG TPA: MarR family winged helix-turn-helix transcriptional regulator [Myxococcota bacterium]
MKKPLHVLPDEPIERRIADGLARLVDAGRVAAWHEAAAHSLSSTQAQVIAELSRSPLRLSDVATALGVSTATTSDAVRVLVQKGIVDKARDPNDGRAVRLELTAEGRRLAPYAEKWRNIFVEAVRDLAAPQRRELLESVVKIMEALQAKNVINVARTCVTCRHFHPSSTSSAAAPHFCDAYDAEYGDAEIKTNCPAHQQKA